jgi:RND superfamily putative drug exporter
MHAFLGRLGRGSARWHWAVIGAWLVLVAGLVLARHAFGGTFADDYGVPGSQSQQGGDVLQREFPQESGYAGQIVFGAPAGSTVAADAAPVNQSVAAVAKLPHVLAAVSPFAQPQSPLVSKDGTVAYATVNFDVPPGGLDTDYLHQLDAAVGPARSAGLEVEYGGGAGQIGQQPNDTGSELVGLACALLLLLFMFGSLVAAAIPLISAMFSVGAGLSLLGLLAAAFTFPTTSPTIATLLGLGVAIDYGLFQVARHREHLDLGEAPVDAAGAPNATSGAAIVVAGSTVVIAILGLFVAGVPFISALGVSAAIVVAVTMLAALTLVPAFLGTAGRSVRALRERRRTPGAAAAGTDAPVEGDAAPPRPPGARTPPAPRAVRPVPAPGPGPARRPRPVRRTGSSPAGAR